jgi:hypothetical protein
LRTGETYFYKVGDTVDVWTTMGAINSAANIETPALVMASAGTASLVTATGVIVAALLF